MDVISRQLLGIHSESIRLDIVGRKSKMDKNKEILEELKQYMSGDALMITAIFPEREGAPVLGCAGKRISGLM